MPRWLLYSLLAVSLWGGWGFLSRVLGANLSSEHTLIISTLATLPIIAVLAVRPANPGRSKLKGSVYAILGGLFGGLGNLSFYELLHAGEKAATIVPLTSLYPVVTIFIALAFLGERLNAIQIAGVVGAIAAIYLFNAGSEGSLANRWLVFAIIPLGCWGISAVFQKLSTNFVSGDRATLWFLIGVFPIAFGVAFKVGFPSQLAANLWILGLSIGALLGLGNLALLAAYANEGKASVITPLSSLYPAVTVPLAIFLLGERVSTREAMGIVLSLVSVVALSLEGSPSATPKP